MRNLNLRFERDPTLDAIEVVIRAPERDETVETLMAKLAAPPPDTVKAFDGSGNMRVIRQEEIILASVEGKLVSLATLGGSWYTRQTLQSLEDTLDKRRFVRISRYELANLDQVLRYDFTIAGTLRIELAGGISTWASRRCIPTIRRRLKGEV